MSDTTCGCQCPAVDPVPVRESQGFAFVPMEVYSPEPALSLPLILSLAVVTVALTLIHQRSSSWCILCLHDTEPTPTRAAFEWKLRLSPGERRFVAAVKACLFGIAGPPSTLLPEANALVLPKVRR
jgi:hypothetical protein